MVKISAATPKQLNFIRGAQSVKKFAWKKRQQSHLLCIINGYYRYYFSMGRYYIANNIQQHNVIAIILLQH